MQIAWRIRAKALTRTRLPRARVRCATVNRAASGGSPFTNVTAERGFLPAIDPLFRLPDPAFDAWETALDEIPKLCLAGPGYMRRQLQGLPSEPLLEALEILEEEQDDGQKMWRMYLLVSFLAHAYMWCDSAPPPSTLPANLAVPWSRVARALGMPPVLVYATYNLFNWHRLDPSQPIALGNLACNNNFLGGMDEEWFRLVHVSVEATAGPALVAIPALQDAAQQEDVEGVRAGLVQISSALEAMRGILARMGERCDPHIYYQRVRLPMSGWRNNPDLPGGLVYEGVSEVPLQLYGETGAQSSIVPAFDAALGIRHEDGWLTAYLQDMRAHMPPPHRAFLAALEVRPSARDLLTSGRMGKTALPGLLHDYNEAVLQLKAFRNQHRAFASAYIAQQSKKAGETGTGGSDFMPALTAYQDATGRFKM